MDRAAAVRVELRNADSRSTWLLYKELEAEGLVVDVDLPPEYRGADTSLQTAVFWIATTALGSALAPMVQSAASKASDTTAKLIERAVRRFRAAEPTAGPVVGPDDIIPRRDN